MDPQTVLRFVGITDETTYKKWCLRNHPDKLPNDPDATRRFQEVQCAYTKVQKSGPTHPAQPAQSSTSRPAQPNWNKKVPPRTSKPAQPSWSSMFHPPTMCTHKRANGQLCFLAKMSRTAYCWYHQPSTTNLQYAVQGDNDGVFDFCGALNRKASYAERGYHTCTARVDSGHYCRNKKAKDMDVCALHHAFNLTNTTCLLRRAKDGRRVCTYSQVPGHKYCQYHINKS